MMNYRPYQPPNTTNLVSKLGVDVNLPPTSDSKRRLMSQIYQLMTKRISQVGKRVLVFLDELEPYLLKTLEDGPFVPMSSLSTSENPLPKRQNQWSNAESRLANQDKRLKNTRDTKIAALRLKFNAFKSLEGEKVNGTFTRLKCLLNDLENNGVITSYSKSECDSQEPLPPLPKLIGAAPSGTSESLISLSDLTLNMADLTLDTPDPKKTRPSVKVSPAYVIKKKTIRSPVGPKPCSDKKADSSIKKLLLTLMEEIKGLKRQIEIPLGTPPPSSQPSSSKASKQKTWFGPCKHCGFRNNLSDDFYLIPKCSTCGSTDHLTKEHLEHAIVQKTLSKLKAQLPLKPSPKKGSHDSKAFHKV
ncbi:hypothetical protein Tco_0978254 [Tanacetum coccineum]|uniref:Uncharacterized protein n=1 Tax=Tanacetum coccineum TaxID=301880 RepID=A0ABQ5EMI4_9ASTR